MISSAGISERSKKSNNSCGSISLARAIGDSPPRLCLGELLIRLIIRFISFCE